MEHPRTDGQRLRLIVAAALALAASLAASAGAATYYVSTGGSDSAAGTSGSPLHTIQAAVNKAAAGDTIVVNDGTYGSNGVGINGFPVNITKSGSASAPITLQAAHNGAAILDCALGCHSYINFGGGSGYWIVKGFDIRNGYWGGVFANSGTSTHITLRNNLIHNIGNRSDSGPYGIMCIYTGNTASSWVIDGNVLHDCGRNSVLTGTHDHGIYTHGSGFQITNNVFYALKNGWHIQTADGFSGTIANNTFYGPDPVGNAGQVMLWGADSNVIVRNNLFYNSNGTGITTYAVSVSGSCSIDHNLAFTSGQTVSIITGAPSNCAQSANKVNVDPKVSAPGAYDFHLLAGSPAIDAGAAVSGVTTDLAGAARPQGAAFDIGAYEYGGLAPTSGGTTPTPTTAPAPTTTPAPTPTPVPAGCTAAAPGAWTNVALSPQAGAFTLAFDATPSQAAMDGSAGVSNGPAGAYTSLAAIVRFNSAGMIDARNDGAYSAAAAIPYTAGKSYHFRLVINLPAHTYSAYVTPAGGAETLLGSNYAFRNEQVGVASLSNLGVDATVGTLTVCSPTATPAAAATGPTLSSVNVSNVTANGATVTWTTSTPADSSVAYGASSTYGSTATGSAATTSHSVALSGLSASTAYHYSAVSKDAAGATTSSPDAVFTTAPAAPPSTCPSASAGTWNNVSLTPQTGGFTVTFDATPSQAAMDGSMGVSNGPASSYTSLAAIVRFNNAGRIDARNDGAYAAAAAIPYSAGTSYHFRLVVNLAAHNYSAYVTPAGGTETLIGANYSFRNEQATLSSANNLGLAATVGTVTACSATAAASTTGGTTGGATGGTTGTPAPQCVSTGAGSWKNETLPSLTGSFTVAYDATPSGGAIDLVNGLSNGAASAYSNLAVGVRFNNSGKIDARNAGAYAAAGSISYVAGTKYHIRLVVNATGHTYSAYVTPAGGSEILIGSNYAFRSEAATTATITNFATYATTGTESLCNLTANGAAVTVK